jgi:site-specific recombinase XerD
MDKPRLLDQIRDPLRVRHYSLRIEASYLQWIKRFILFHNKRHPLEMGVQEITAFLTHLAVNKHVAPPTQNQALAAILSLYKEVLEQELGWMDDIVRARRTARIPEVLSPEQVRRLIARLENCRANKRSALRRMEFTFGALRLSPNAPYELSRR